MGAGAPVRLPRISSLKDDGSKYLNKPDFGRVPTYLLERKIDLIERQEADVRAKEAAMIPLGRWAWPRPTDPANPRCAPVDHLPNLWDRSRSLCLQAGRNAGRMI